MNVEWFNVETALRLVSYRSLGHVMQKMKRHIQAKGEADLGTAPKRLSRVERKQKSVTLKRKQCSNLWSLWKGNDEYTCTPLAITLGAPWIFPCRSGLGRWSNPRTLFNQLRLVIWLFWVSGIEALQGVQEHLRQTWCTVVAPPALKIGWSSKAFACRVFTLLLVKRDC